MVVWRVCPSIQQCLSKQWSLSCDLPQRYLEVMGAELLLTSQTPYNLLRFDLHSQKQTGCLATEHSDHLTGQKTSRNIFPTYCNLFTFLRYLNYLTCLSHSTYLPYVFICRVLCVS